MSFFWNKYSDKLYKKYGLMLTIEAVIYILLLIMLISYRMNLLAYYI